MGRAFAEIAFTPAVRAAQVRYGSREANAAYEAASDSGMALSANEASFIALRDSFYLATVSESGWPYVQFRGGPPGFLKVLSPNEIGFADFRGNVQYVSAGNIAADGRASLILMDYPNRQRLKLLGRARVVHGSDNEGLLARLTVLRYRARVERAIVIAIEAFDWNCPQHITPRFSAEEIRSTLQPLIDEATSLRDQASGS